MNKEIRQMNFSKDDTASVIINSLARVAAASAYKNWGSTGLIEAVELPNYMDEMQKTKKAQLAFSANKAGLSVPTTSTELAYAFDNTIFRSIMNSITVQSIGSMMVRYTSPRLDRIMSIENVEVGGSKTYTTEPKALPVAQRGTYGSNVNVVPSYAKGGVTVTPKPYTLGSSLDYIRILANDYDWGMAVARIYAGMLFAQYKLGVNQVFNTTVLAGTPFYNATFGAATYVQLGEDIGMLNGGNASNVTALGTRVAWNAINAFATQGGFTTKDDYIKNAFLQKIYGIDSEIVDQFTDLSQPFTSANATSLRTIPNNLVVIVPDGTDKIVKLVREDYIRVIETPAIENTLNRLEYTYFQNFDAKIATASFFGVQNTATA